MSASIQMLMVEDVEDDALLLVAELRRAGQAVEFERVQDEPGLRAALARKAWDVILCDFTLPGFNGSAALRLAKELSGDTPFIFVSGTIGETVAVEAMRAGAQDYVMKDNLARLAPAVARELAEAATRREGRRSEIEMRESEHKYRQLFDALSDAVFVIDEETGRVIDTNARSEALLERTRAEIVGANEAVLFTSAGGMGVLATLRTAGGSQRVGCELEVRRTGGGLVRAHASVSRIELYGRAFLLLLLHGGEQAEQTGSGPGPPEADAPVLLSEAAGEQRIPDHIARLTATAVGCLAMASGALALAGWAWHVDALRSVLPGQVAMKANTALAFVLIGAALVLTGRRDGGDWRGRVASRVCAGLAGLIGLLTLAQYSFGWQPGIDNWLVEEPAGAVGTSVPGRMAPDSALGFVILALAVSVLSWKKPPVWALAAGAAGGLLIALLATGALQSYATPGLGKFGWWGQTIMAVPTGVTFLALGLAVAVNSWRARLFAWLLPGWVTLIFAAGLAVLVMLNLNASRAHTRFSELKSHGAQIELETVTDQAYILTSAGTLTTIVIFGAVLFALNRAEAGRRRAEEALRWRAAIIDSTEDAVIGESLEGFVTSWNKGAERLLGYGAGEMLGQRLSRLMPDGREAEDRVILERIGRGECVEHFETMRRAKDGRLVELSVTASPVLDARGRVAGASKVARDITARKRAERALVEAKESLERRVAERTAELQRQHDDLEAANRELEAFSYSVSHDLRAPLRSIDGFSKIVLTQHGEELSAEAREALELVRANSQQMGRLIDGLLVFAKLNRRALRKVEARPGELVRECLEMFRLETQGRQVEIVIGELAPCRADVELLRLVWANLLSNALKYTRGREPARIEIGSRSEAGRPTVYHVRDNGVGFKMAYAHKLFGVFQRLHRAEDYEGTGVGLATAHRIVTRHGGRIWTEAEPERGAAFFFTLEPDKTS